MSPRFNQPATSSLVDALAKNPANLGTVWKGRIESRKYRQEPGNFTNYGWSQVANKFGCKTEEIYRIEYGFGNLHVIATLRSGLQKEVPVEAFFLVLQPNKSGGYEINPTQEIKEYY